MGGFQRARAFALSLPGASEEPHFDMSSFRVNGKIFATVPPGEEYLHVFVDETEAEASVAEDPPVPLLWPRLPPPRNSPPPPHIAWFKDPAGNILAVLQPR